MLASALMASEYSFQNLDQKSSCIGCKLGYPGTTEPLNRHSPGTLTKFDRTGF